MKTQLIVCDRVEFNPERRQHRLGHVLNWIEVPAFPCVVDLAVFIKIHHLAYCIGAGYIYCNYQWTNTCC